MITALANLLGPWGTVLGFLLILGGLAEFGRRLLKYLRRIMGAADAANRSAQTAADKATNAEKQTLHTQTATRATSADVIALAEELADERQENLKEREAVEQMRKQIDNMLTVELRLLSLLDQRKVAERIDRLEGWAQDVSHANQRPGPRDEPLRGATEDGDAFTTTGRHRFPTRAITTIQEDQ